jgi:hypothetical protein
MYDDDKLIGNKQKFRTSHTKSHSHSQKTSRANRCNEFNRKPETIEIHTISSPSPVTNFMNYEIKCHNTILNSQAINKNMNSTNVSNWIIDSEASIHMCNDSSILEGFRYHQGQFVTISNGVSIPITGFGDLSFRISDSNNLSHNNRSEKCRVCSTVNCEFIEDSCFMLKPQKIKIGLLKQSLFTLSITHKSHTEQNNSFACIHEWHRK